MDSGLMVMHSLYQIAKNLPGMMCCFHFHVKTVHGFSLYLLLERIDVSVRCAPCCQNCVFKEACISGLHRPAPQDLTSLIFSHGSCQNFRMLVIAGGVSEGCLKSFPCLQKTLLHNGSGEMRSGLGEMWKSYRVASKSKHPSTEGFFFFSMGK